MSDSIRNFKILYSEYSNMQKKALEFLSKEVGALINRDPGVYTFHVLPFINDEKDADANIIATGTYENSSFIRKYINKNDVPENGYLIKVFDNPEKPDFKIAIIVGDTDREVFYGAVDFVDDYLATVEASGGGPIIYPDKVFYKKLPDYSYASFPKVKTRSIFTWGHPIADYKDYIENMARLKLNQLIIWNDFVPLNADDIVDYAHQYGIELLWGYAWGWSRKCSDFLENGDINILKDEIIKEYEEKYSGIKGDGIYFQSFTELGTEEVAGKVVAEVVSELVNITSSELLSLHPDLKIQFGLHATSVTNKLKFIDKVDKRVEIVWEDCGDFPFSYAPNASHNYDVTSSFIKEILNLRDGEKVGMYYKGQLTCDWTDWEWGAFEHQKGRYILGCESKETIENDAKTVNGLWQPFQRYWLENGKKAYDMTNMIIDKTAGEINLGLAGQFSGKIRFSNALCAQILWDAKEDYKCILNKVLKRRYISF